MGRLDGKVVVVTGAARGQGAEEVRALAAEGATVVATDVLDFVPFDEEGAGWDVRVVERHLDVTSGSDWADLASWLSTEHGRVDALVNNAGVAGRERLPDVSLEQWRRTFDINVTGPMLGIQALVPLMPAGSSIVNICSVAAVSGMVRPGQTLVAVPVSPADDDLAPIRNAVRTAVCGSCVAPEGTGESDSSTMTMPGSAVSDEPAATRSSAGAPGCRRAEDAVTYRPVAADRLTFREFLAA